MLAELPDCGTGLKGVIRLADLTSPPFRAKNRTMPCRASNHHGATETAPMEFGPLSPPAIGRVPSGLTFNV